MLDDLRGKRFSRLTVLERSDDVVYGTQSKVAYLCRCDCGNEKVIVAQHLKRGTCSCGCQKRDAARLAHLTHGMRQTPEYKIWAGIRNRGLNRNTKAYPAYGGRGIFICPRWLNSFEHFYADMGSRPSLRHSIERIDNNLGYSPDNCRWATRSEQNRNKRNNHLITLDGETLPLAVWADRLNVPYHRAKNRINRLNWTAERALLTPVLPTGRPRCQ